MAWLPKHVMFWPKVLNKGGGRCSKLPQGARLPQHVNLPCPATPTSKSAQEQKYQRFAQKICSRDQDKDYYVAVQETKW